MTYMNDNGVDKMENSTSYRGKRRTFVLPLANFFFFFQHPQMINRLSLLL